MFKVFPVGFFLSTSSIIAKPIIQINGALNNSWRDTDDDQVLGFRAEIKASVIQTQAYEVFAGARYFNWNSTHLYEVKHDPLGSYLNREATYYTLPDSKANYIGGVVDLVSKKSIGRFMFFIGLDNSLNLMIKETFGNEEVLNRCFYPRHFRNGR